MVTLIILLPLIGSILLLPIKDEGNGNTSSLVQQIGLSTSLLVLFLTFVLFLYKSFGYDNYYLVNSTLNTISSVSHGNEIGVFVPLSIQSLDNVDSISFFYILLTAIITPICLLSNWTDVPLELKYFLISFLLLETLQIAVFVVLDLFLFYIFFESVLIPLFTIVVIWGSENRFRAAFLLFLYTLAGSLFMLLAILSYLHYTATTDFLALFLLDGQLDYQKILWLSFFISFFLLKSLLLVSFYYN